MTQKQIYPIASANRRIWARILDLIICTCVIIGIDVLIVLVNGTRNIDDFATWKYLLMGLVLVICDFIYFILVPYLTKKGTLMNIAFKTKIVNQKGNYLVNLIKKELFIWVIIDGVILVIGIVLCFLNGKEAHDLINAITDFTNADKFSALQVIATVFNSFLTFLFILVLIVFANTIYNSRRHTWLDNFSNTTMAYMVSTTTKPIETKTKKLMPGIMDEEDEKELNNL